MNYHYHHNHHPHDDHDHYDDDHDYHHHDDDDDDHHQHHHHPPLLPGQGVTINIQTIATSLAFTLANPAFHSPPTQHPTLHLWPSNTTSLKYP